MPDNEDDLPVSEVVDLDPDPPSRSTPGHLREFMLGALLIAGVVAWGAWQWLHQQALQSDYTIAQQAAERRDWDTALVHFTAADDYRDSRDRAAEAKRLIAQRDKDYADLGAAIGGQDWLSALRAVDLLRTIQPGYRDSDTLATEARQQITRDVLSGAIAQRPDAQPPGLYLRTADEWTYLQGSDKSSGVLGVGPNQSAVYDAPVDPSNSQSERRLVAVWLDGGKPKFRPLAMDPARYFSFVVGEEGIWGTRYPFAWENDPGGVQTVYQAFDSPFTSTLTLPGPHWEVLDYSRDGRHTLLGETTSTPSGIAASRLFVANADGSQPRMVYATNGTFENVRFNSDASYILANTVIILPDGPQPMPRAKAAILISATGSQPPRSLLDTGLTSDYTLLDSSFLGSGPWAGNVITVLTVDQVSIIRVYDPTRPATPILDARVPGMRSAGLWVDSASSGKGIALAWQNGWEVENNISVVWLAPGRAAASSSVPLAQGEKLRDVQVRSGYLVYATTRDPRTDKSNPATMQEFALRSIPLDGIGTQQERQTLLYRGPMLDLPNAPGLYPWALGSRLVAYSQLGTLSVENYDGSGALPLDASYSIVATLPGAQIPVGGR